MSFDWLTAAGFVVFIGVIGVLVYVCSTGSCGG